MAAHIVLSGARRKEAGMMSKRDNHTALVLFCCLWPIIFVGAFGVWLSRCYTPSVPIVADTITVYDTLTVVQPAPVAVVPLPDVVKRLPRWIQSVNKNAQRDSALTGAVQISSIDSAYSDTAMDSVAVIVPMEQKVYTDSANYRAVISGAWVALDTIEVYPRREIVTIKQPPDNRHWGVSLMAGYGWAGKWTPFVGVGVSFNLFRF